MPIMLASETPASMNRSGYFVDEPFGIFFGNDRDRARSQGEVGLQANHVGILFHQFAERLGVNYLQIKLVKKHINSSIA
jgi:hypothetical protein